MQVSLLPPFFWWANEGSVRFSNLSSASQRVTEQMLQPRTSWTLRPTILITDVSCEPGERICELQIPFCFAHWAPAQEPTEGQSSCSQAQECGWASPYWQRENHLRRLTPPDPPRPDHALCSLEKRSLRGERHPAQDQWVTEQGFTPWLWPNANLFLLYVSQSRPCRSRGSILRRLVLNQGT